MMADSLLRGFRALDLTDEKGFVCGKVLATLGVEVIKVEKPGGDPARGIPPFLNNTPDPEKSLYWFAFNTDKRSITLDLEVSQGQDLFRKLVARADFVIESFVPGYMDSLGLGYEALRQVNPRIIMTSITPFGQEGPYAQYKGSELIASAMGGILLTTGDPDRPPVREGPDSIYFHAGAAGALGAVMAHYHREIAGEGQQVDVSLQGIVASRTFTNLVIWEFDKRLLKRSGSVRRIGPRATRWIWQCKDGYVFWAFMPGPFGAPANRALSKWIDEDGLENPLNKIVNWNELDIAAIPREEIDAQQDAIARFFMNHTKKEITEEGLKRGINAASVDSPADVLENRQLEARDYWVDLEHPGPGITITYPKHFFLSNETENFVKREAPLVGEGNEDIYVKELGLSRAEITALKKAGVI
jgi:crotonobetainyl-CoA:carnitine CoA-transferase CaiB-like acyl-CoA transferase